MAHVAYNRGQGVGANTWTTGVIRAMLLTSAYTPNKDHDYVSDLTNELSGGSYARQTLGSKTADPNDTADRLEYISATLNFGAMTGTFRYLVLYVQVGGDDTTPADDILLDCFDFTTDQVANGAGLTIACPAAGWHNDSQAP